MLDPRTTRSICAAIAGGVGARRGDARVHEPWAADSRSWPSINPGTIEVLADLKADGTTLALLFNAARTPAAVPARPARRFLRASYVRGGLGLLKPHPKIYQHVLYDLGISATEAVFIDNREANVRGAKAFGVTDHVFTDVTALRAFLTSLSQAGRTHR